MRPILALLLCPITCPSCRVARVEHQSAPAAGADLLVSGMRN